LLLDGPFVLDGLFRIPLAGRVLRSGSGPAASSGREVALRHFIAGPENGLAVVAVLATVGSRSVMEAARPIYSPLVLVGPPGSGKSHVAWAVASTWKACFPRDPVARDPVVCTTAAAFAQELADALDAQTVDDFRSVYRRASLAVVEDIEHLENKAAAQQELADTMDVLVDAGARVILTSSKVPVEVKGLNPRLQGRLAAGLTVPLVAPGPQARCAILREAAELAGVSLPEAAAQMLAEGLPLLVPELVGTLWQLELSAQLDGASIDAERVREYLAARSGARGPSLRAIALTTARHFAVRLTELQSPSRRRTIVTARDIAMYLARALTGQSLEHIGRYFGGRDHSTVAHGCRKTEELLQTEPALREAVLGLRDRLLQTA
jgi:chromosomal replication initiator protein